MSDDLHDQPVCTRCSTYLFDEDSIQRSGSEPIYCKPCQAIRELTEALAKAIDGWRCGYPSEADEWNECVDAHDKYCGAGYEIGDKPCKPGDEIGDG